METYPAIEVAAFIGTPLLVMVPWEFAPFAGAILLILVCIVDFFYGLNLTRSSRAAVRRRR